MKFKTKKSLIITTAMFVFSGIFGLAEASVQEKGIFDKFKIRNNIKYEVEVEFGMDKEHPSFRPELYVIPTNIILLADGSLESSKQGQLEQDGLSTGFTFEINPYHRNLIFICYSKECGSYLSSDINVLKYTVIDEDLKEVGDFTVIIYVDDQKTLNIMIDSKDKDLKASAK